MDWFPGFPRFTQTDLTIYEGRLRLQVVVRDNNVDQALRALKKKLQREGGLPAPAAAARPARP